MGVGCPVRATAQIGEQAAVESGRNMGADLSGQEVSSSEHGGEIRWAIQRSWGGAGDTVNDIQIPSARR